MLKHIIPMLCALGVMKMDTPKKPNQREGYRHLYLKKSTWQLIQLAHGWKGRGSVKAFGDAIRVTRQYASGIVTNSFGCSTNVLMAVKNLLGIRRGECWCHLFDEKKIDVDDNHPLWNDSKFRGEKPYIKDSLSASFRRLDYPAESEQDTSGGA